MGSSQHIRVWIVSCCGLIRRFPNTPSFKENFDTHVAKVDIDEKTGGYAIDKKGSIKGGHNSVEFEAALQNPRGDGVPALVVNRKKVFDSAGNEIGEEIEYSVPRVNGNGPNIGKSSTDDNGNILYKSSQKKLFIILIQYLMQKWLQL